jgi:hypothetical protein
MLASKRSMDFVNTLSFTSLVVWTYSHAHRDHKTDRGTNDFTMAGVLVTGTD